MSFFRGLFMTNPLHAYRKSHQFQKLYSTCESIYIYYTFTATCLNQSYKKIFWKIDKLTYTVCLVSVIRMLVSETEHAKYRLRVVAHPCEEKQWRSKKRLSTRRVVRHLCYTILSNFHFSFISITFRAAYCYHSDSTAANIAARSRPFHKKIRKKYWNHYFIQSERTA